MTFKAHCDLCDEPISDGTRAWIVFDATKELNGQAPLHICRFCRQNIIYWQGRAAEGRLRTNPPQGCDTCCFWAKTGCMNENVPEGSPKVHDACPHWAEHGDANDGLA